MAEAFMGYLLPWGQMSYWGAQVIVVNLFSAIPLSVRSGSADPWRLCGGRCDSEPLLQLPRDRRASGAAGSGGCAFCWRCIDVGSNNPDGIEIKGPNALQG